MSKELTTKDKATLAAALKKANATKGLRKNLSGKAAQLMQARAVLDMHERDWDRIAKKCEHSQKGGDGLECSNPKQGRDPFCYDTNCPRVKI